MAASLDANDAKLFDETLKLLKGLPELGVLLRMEQEIPHLIRTIYGDSGDLFAQENMERWEQAEGRLREALENFIKAAQATYQGRLFAQDALEGLRLMDLVEQFNARIQYATQQVSWDLVYELVYTLENVKNVEKILAELPFISHPAYWTRQEPDRLSFRASSKTSWSALALYL